MKRWIRPASAAVQGVLGFAAFLLLVAFLNEWEATSERTRSGAALFITAFLILVAIELRCYYRFRSAFAYWRFLGQHAGAVFLIGTTRKGWYPLLAAVGRSDSGPVTFVWWRERNVSPLRALELRRPPTDLPCLVFVSRAGVSYVSLGMFISSFRRTPLGQNVGLALRAIDEVAEKAAT